MPPLWGSDNLICRFSTKMSPLWGYNVQLALHGLLYELTIGSMNLNGAVGNEPDLVPSAVEKPQRGDILVGSWAIMFDWHCTISFTN